MNFKKYIPSSTTAVQIVLVVIVAGALGLIAMGTDKIKGLLGRF